MHSGRMGTLRSRGISKIGIPFRQKGREGKRDPEITLPSPPCRMHMAVWRRLVNVTRTLLNLQNMSKTLVTPANSATRAGTVPESQRDSS